MCGVQASEASWRRTSLCDQKGKSLTKKEKTGRKFRVTEAQSRRGKLEQDKVETKSLHLEEISLGIFARKNYTAPVLGLANFPVKAKE